MVLGRGWDKAGRNMSIPLEGLRLCSILAGVFCWAEVQQACQCCPTGVEAAWERCYYRQWLAACWATLWCCCPAWSEPVTLLCRVCCRELLYLAAIFFQGGAGGGITGFVNNMRQWLWIPVSQDAYR